jgi:hypothetical protein
MPDPLGYRLSVTLDAGQEQTVEAILMIVKSVINRTMPVLILIAATAIPAKQGQCADPLPSWNDASVKTAIVQFVTAVVTKGGPKYVPAEQRIATFDNDGTLWSEQPVIQGMFLMHRLDKMA